MLWSINLRMLLAALAVLASVVMCVHKLDRGARLPGNPVAGAPVQDESRRRAAFEFDGYTIAPFAQFTVRARLLSSERYRVGREADLSPIDFALGWDDMSNDAVLDRLEISQGNRFFYYRYQGEPPLPVAVITRSASNMHLIPADDRVRRRLEDVRRGATVTLRGWLVDASAPDGWHWRSSRTREDSGAGACELFWVEEVEVEG